MIYSFKALFLFYATILSNYFLDFDFFCNLQKKLQKVAMQLAIDFKKRFDSWIEKQGLKYKSTF
jgi:hypothetical protein